MPEYSKKELAKLRDLASEAYERELGEQLTELEKSFAAWRRSEKLSSELSKEIHEFHQGVLSNNAFERTAKDRGPRRRAQEMMHPTAAMAASAAAQLAR